MNNERGLSVPDAEMLISLSEVFEIPVSTILGENIEEKEKNDIKVISEKLEVINEQLSIIHIKKRKRILHFLIILDACILLLFLLLAVLGSPYQSWDYRDPEWSIIGTVWHGFEWLFFKVAPILVIIITSALGIFFIKQPK
ncbi:MAG: transcriptional regulator [Bacilli bacterium]|nr:transcriptional regulator [Bacilli bacterium]